MKEQLRAHQKCEDGMRSRETLSKRSPQGDGCHRLGAPTHLDTKKKTSKCGMNWCRSDRKGRSHLKSTKSHRSERLCRTQLRLLYWSGCLDNR